MSGILPKGPKNLLEGHNGPFSLLPLCHIVAGKHNGVNELWSHSIKYITITVSIDSTRAPAQRNGTGPQVKPSITPEFQCNVIISAVKREYFLFFFFCLIVPWSQCCCFFFALTKRICKGRIRVQQIRNRHADLPARGNKSSWCPTCTTNVCYRSPVAKDRVATRDRVWAWEEFHIF